MEATRVLRDEHRLIGRVLDAFEIALRRFGQGVAIERTMFESFFVLSGTVRIFDGSEWIDAGPGDFVHVPPGGIHAFRNESGAPASMLIHFAPGAPREAYFEGLNRLEEMSEGERSDFFVAHDNLFVEG